MRINSIFIVFLFIASCTKTEYIKEYIIEEPNSISDTLAPGAFNLTVNKITDNSAYLEWESAKGPDGYQVKYDIAINDSVVAYDLSNNSFTITDLSPDTKYSVSVIALDPERNSTKVTTEFHTMKSFIQSVILIGADFEYFSIEKAIKTSDNGLLIGGRITETTASDQHLVFIMKINKSYDIEWLHIFQNNEDIYELQDLKELSDMSFLVVRNSSITKVSIDGKELWSYRTNTPETYFTCATEDNSGNYIISGHSERQWGQEVSSEYFIIKLSALGNELWFKYGGTTLFNYPIDIIIEPNGNILLFGSAEYLESTFQELSYAQTCFWLLWANENGELIRQELYPNEYNESDSPKEIFLTKDQKYLLLGTAHGAVPPYYYSGSRPRFLKVSNEGTVIWDKYHNLNSGGVSPVYEDFAVLETNQSLILTGDDRGIAISQINDAGEIDKHIKLYGYPRCVNIFIDDNGNYQCVAKEGYIIIFNHNGYIVE